MRWYGRLRRSSEIAFVRRRGRRAGAATLVGYGVEARDGVERTCITVSKAVGGAVVRNLVRRRIRGALDALPRPALPLRVVLVAAPEAAAEPYARLAADVASIRQRLSARS